MGAKKAYIVKGKTPKQLREQLEGLPDDAYIYDFSGEYSGNGGYDIEITFVLPASSKP